jgi:CelD/BcsL family acetyltransferase involved in cellulose biosynthesis
MDIEVINTTARFESLKDEWTDLSSAIEGASFFVTYYYIKTAWDHFSGTSDKLLILLLKENNQVVSIVPLRLSIENYWSIPARVIRFIGEWEGDRPGILTLIDENRVWNEVFRFLNHDFKGWDSLNLVEQPTYSPFFEIIRQSAIRHSIRTLKDSICFSSSLEGTWEDFFAARKSSVRRNWRNRNKRLQAHSALTSVEHFSEPDSIEEAIDRFVAIEKSSWKAEAEQGVSKDATHLDFNKALAIQLAKKGMILISFLKLGDQNIAGAILYKFKDTLYERHIAYDNAWKKYSPGIILKAELIHYGFENSFRQYDHLGMREGQLHRKKHSQEWSTKEEEMIKIIVIKKMSRMLPVVMGIGLRSYIKKLRVNVRQGTNWITGVAHRN